MSAPAVLHFTSRWRVLPGTARGLRLPVMESTVRVNAVRPPDFAALDRAMARYGLEAAPAVRSGHGVELALVERALHWAGAVQRHFNVPVFESGRAGLERRAGAETGELRVTVPYAIPQASALALAWAGEEIARVLMGETPAPHGRGAGTDRLDKLEEALRKFRPAGVNTFRFLRAAQELDIPVRRVVSGVYCYGTGHHSRWLESSCTDASSVIGCRIAKDKFRAAVVLRQSGMPAPSHVRVATAEQAAAAAGRLGYPVVVKPADLDQGVGVAADLRDAAAVVTAFREARRHSRNVLVEKHFHGNDYRLTVFNGRVIKTVTRIPGGVYGDGSHTVARLVELAGEDAQQSRRARERGGRLLVLDAEALQLLAENRLSPDSVPARGEYVCLRRRANVSAGGSPVLVDPQRVHADNRRLAERAAAALRLDIAGVDLIMQDISKSWLETGALICEVNGQPQIGAGTTPGIYAEMLRKLLPGGFRIPVVLLVTAKQGGGSRFTPPKEIPGATVGCSASEGIWLGGKRLAGAQSSEFRAAQALMAGPEVDAALVVMSPAEIRRSGLPFDRCDVAVFGGVASGEDSDPAAFAEMLDMVLPHARKVRVSDPDDAALLPHRARLGVRGGLGKRRAGNGLALAAQELKRLVRAARPVRRS